MAGIIVLGTIIRILYFLKPRSFWGDEWFTIFTSHQRFKDVIVSIFESNHPPLSILAYYFGGYRLLPLIAGILSLYFFSKLSKDKIATFLFAISPYFIHLSGETRGYGFVCLLSIMALLGYRWAFPIAIFTEHYAWFLLLAIPFSIWFLPFMAGSAAMIAYQSVEEHVFTSGRFEWHILIIVKKILGLFIQFGGGIKYSFLTLKQGLVCKPYIVFFALPAIFLFYARNKRYLKLFLIPIIALLIFYPVRLNSRYLSFCGLSYLILISEGFRRMSLKNNIVARFIMISFIIANIVSLVWLFSINYDPCHREDYIGASQYIKENIGKSDGLIGCRAQIKYYLKKDFPEDGNAIWEVFLGNPDMALNNDHFASQEKLLKRRVVLTKNFGDLVWVIKYAK